ncbi:hypothetical protein [Frankia sp. Cr1]|uniref:hypothetical protein n=1 Tax=Frankia sp. Cr1 TaxID=3073931 RepID=UPI002AD2D7E2|nr:hypothetical protein [Frankia sp. Cr1]
MNDTGWSQGLAGEVGGRDVVSHVGTAMVWMLADRGRVFTDIAVTIAEGEPREGTDVTELTGLYRTGTKGDQLKGWPGNMRALARRERPHPGAQLPLFALTSESPTEPTGCRSHFWRCPRPTTTDS